MDSGQVEKENNDGWGSRVIRIGLAFQHREGGPIIAWVSCDLSHLTTHTQNEEDHKWRHEALQGINSLLSVAASCRTTHATSISSAHHPMAVSGGACCTVGGDCAQLSYLLTVMWCSGIGVLVTCI